jgi:hypothetical protein
MRRFGSAPAIVTIYVMMSGSAARPTRRWSRHLILGVVPSLGISAVHLYGGIGPMFKKIAAAARLLFPGNRQSVRMVRLHRALDRCRLHGRNLRAAYSAKDARLPAQRDRPADLPAHTAVRVLRGFAAVLQVPGLKGQTPISRSV